MVVKTFRGLLADGGQDRIRLSTIKGKVGYRIAKLKLMPNLPGDGTQESLVKIYTDEQATVPLTGGTVDFTDSSLLAAGFVGQTSTGSQYPPVQIILFDQEIFNQDIYITHTEQTGNTNKCNYYLELEVVPLDDAGAEYTTLKDMRAE